MSKASRQTSAILAVCVGAYATVLKKEIGDKQLKKNIAKAASAAFCAMAQLNEVDQATTAKDTVKITKQIVEWKRIRDERLGDASMTCLLSMSLMAIVDLLARIKNKKKLASLEAVLPHALAADDFFKGNYEHHRKADLMLTALYDVVGFEV